MCGLKLSMLNGSAARLEGLNNFLSVVKPTVDKSVLLGYDVAAMGKRITTFRSSWIPRLLKMSLRYNETSGSEHPWTQRYI